MSLEQYAERVYSGILGKIIGVYAGRPVEGWSYDHIREVFGDVRGYVHKELGMPLHVPDDDLSGTFAFLRTLEDCGSVPKPEDYGATWLNYVIENRTIFWWGGMGRSTEHTAYLRLKNGIPSPASGSIETNGRAIAEQIGAMIFIDGFALICPNDPARARAYAKSAAAVSHDGFAVEAACFLVTLETLAFQIRGVDALLDAALANAEWSEELGSLVKRVRTQCAETTDYRKVRDWLEVNYGYHLYSGNCHVVPNFALILAAFLLGGDDFAKAMEIVISCGWDTDCNAANLGCLNGIRLGLGAISGAYSNPVADRFYCITSLGSQCVTDAAQQTERIIRLHAKIYGKEPPVRKPRFHFSYPGAVQGFTSCPVVGEAGQHAMNANLEGGMNGLLLSKEGTTALSTLTFWDPADRYGGYELLGSPTLYEGQAVRVVVHALSENVSVRAYVVYTDVQDAQQVCYGDGVQVAGEQEITWRIPSLGGMPIERVGVQMIYPKPGERVLLRSMDWDGAPKCLTLQAVLREEETGRPRRAFDMFAASATQFTVDKVHTFCVSHNAENGIADFGTEDWRDYTIEASVIPSMHLRCGLVARTHGHRRYYAAVLEGGSVLRLLCRNGDTEMELAACDLPYREEEPIVLSLTCRGNALEVSVNGEKLLAATHELYVFGGAGFLASCGTMLVDGLSIRAEEDQNDV